MNKSKKIWIAALLLVAVAGAYAATQFSLGGQIETRIERLMNQYSLADPEVNIGSYNSSHIDFSSIKFKQGKQDYTLKNVRIRATNLPYRELLQKNYANIAAEWTVESIEVGGIDYKLPPLAGNGALQMKEGKPVVTGEFQDAGNTHSGHFTVTSAIALLENLRAAQGALEIRAAEIVIPYDAAKPILVESVTIAQEKLRAALDTVTLKRKASEEGFAADWDVDRLAVSGVDYDIPALAGTGHIYTKNDALFADGSVRNAKRDYSGEFTYGNSVLTLKRLRMPWEGASVVAERIVVEIGKNKPIVIPISVSKLPLDTLLDKITKDKASGTGVVSGGAEITIHPDKSFTIRNGNLQAEETGVIKLSADALPGDKKQLEITRDVLSNFHYNILSIKTSTAKDGETAIQLTIEGNNPDAYDGRIVKLNINLTGDVVDLLNQTILPLADPLQYLQKERS